MRNLLTLIALFILSSSIYCQIEVTNQKGYYQKFGIDDIRYALDSLYKYIPNDEEWIIDFKANTTKYNSDGNPEGVLYKFWKNDNKTWSNKDTVILKYYNKETRKFSLRKSWNSEFKMWNDTTYYVEYSPSGKIVKLKYKIWDYISNKATHGTTYIYLYDNTGRIVSKKSLKLNKETLKWENKDLKQYKYNENNQLDTSILKKWSESATWQNWKRALFVYNTEGLKIERKEDKWNNATSEWENNTITYYEYDANGNLSQENIDKWKNDDWVHDQKIIYNYDANGNIIEKDKFIMLGVSEINTIQRLYKYDSNNNQIEYIIKTYDTEKQELVNNTTQIDEYDDNNNNTKTIIKIWDKTAENWKNKAKYEMFWSKINSSSVSIQKPKSIVIYPNPTSGLLHLDADDFINVKIYNQSGLLLDEINNTNIVDLSKLTNGVYFVVLLSKNSHIIKKIIKL